FLHVRAFDCSPSDIMSVGFLDWVMCPIFVSAVKGEPVDVLRKRREAISDGTWKFVVSEIGHTAPLLWRDRGFKRHRVSKLILKQWPGVRRSSHTLTLSPR